MKKGITNKKKNTQSISLNDFRAFDKKLVSLRSLY